MASSALAAFMKRVRSVSSDPWLYEFTVAFIEAWGHGRYAEAGTWSRKVAEAAGLVCLKGTKYDDAYALLGTLKRDL